MLTVITPFSCLASKQEVEHVGQFSMQISSGNGSVLSAYQQQTSLWMKRHKSELRAFVKAGIYIEPNAAKRLATKAFALMYEKFWGFPMLTVATRDEALALARKLLPAELTNARP